jgi:hypothetical protein
MPTKDWREPYLAALLEMDSIKLKRKVEVALAAIESARASQKQGSAAHERQAMNDAISALNSLLRRIKPGPPANR